MKVAINIQADIQEIKVIINCMAEDENVQRIVSALDSLNTKLCCRRQGELFQIALNDILYIESVDRKTFIYTEQQIYETDGLPSLILDLLGIADRGTGISIWLIAVILSSAVLILALYLLERHYRRVGEKYDSALSQYKTREEAIPAE